MTTDWKSIVEVKDEEAAAHLIYRLYTQGASSMQLAHAMGVTDVTIRNLFNKYDLPLKRHGGLYKGIGTKITKKDYKNLTYKQLAKKYEVSLWTVWHKTKKFRKKVKDETNP